MTVGKYYDMEDESDSCLTAGGTPPYVRLATGIDNLQIRDLFALVALHGQVAARQNVQIGKWHQTQLARDAYSMADAMITARNP